jgi:hypothetical protein
MKIKLLINFIICFVGFVIGATLHDDLGMKSLGDLIAYSSIWIFIFLSVYIYKVPDSFSFIGNLSHNKNKKNAYEELMNLKKLLNEDAITQREFDLKAEKLKKFIL